MTLAGSAALAAGTSPDPPVTLEVDRQPALVQLEVVGSSNRTLDATYSLEVSGGGNRSVQSGTVHLEPDKRVTLISLRLKGASAGLWNAKLAVTPSEGQPYEVWRTSSD